MKKPRKQPMRMCIGCGEMKPKKELVRVVRGADGVISLDPGGRKPGRGAYLCKSPECLRKAEKAKRLEHALGCAVPKEVYEQLEKEMTSDGGS